MSAVRKAIAALALIAAGFFGHALATGDDAGPYCPTEDRCTVDYRNGAWHVTEATP